MVRHGQVADGDVPAQSPFPPLGLISMRLILPREGDFLSRGRSTIKHTSPSLFQDKHSTETRVLQLQKLSIWDLMPIIFNDSLIVFVKHAWNRLYMDLSSLK